jgi:Tol biopolymer transport system component/tRNA A-37 threonylcarbamoyl transferase component Bud32
MLSAGTRVGPYEIVSWLGAGSMGEVYRARDTKLDREVALKTLPEELARQPERLARLRQEARILASLNHPGIATLHGLEESDSGVPVLVMELVEGEALSDRLHRGPFSPREAVAVAHQIALALEAANDKGVLHRDLKPGNIRIALDGRVKLLDFGLAKAVLKAALDSQSNTHTSPHSEAGAVVGTAPYMSPEQARGQGTDRRSDIWAFGCVLYEMLARKRAFEGATFSDTVAAVLDREPDWQALPGETPTAVLRLLRRCLQKETGKRLRDIGDARLELEELVAAGAAAGGENDAAVIGPRPRIAWGGLIRSRLLWLMVGAMAAGAGLWDLGTSRPVAERPIVRLAIPLSPPESVGVGAAPAVAISPDGTQLAYVAARGGVWQIYLRTLGRLEARPIPGTEGGESPFFSPDGHWLGFFAETETKLKKVPLSGGAPLTLCDGVPQAHGASWGPDGSVVFTRHSIFGLERVSADSGVPEALTTLDASRGEGSHRLPEILPGGQAVVFTVKTADTSSFDDARIEVVSLKTRERSVLVTGGTNARYAGGHLIYERAGALWAAPFDPARLKVTGPSVLVLEGVSSSPESGSADFGVSRDGSLVYVPGRPRGTDRRVLRVDRTARSRPLMDLRRAFAGISLSPDGRRLALEIEGANNHLWVYDLERSTLTPQTLRWNNIWAIWTPDGRGLTFASNREGLSNLFWQPADGSGPTERLTPWPSEHWKVARSWSPDGKTLVFCDLSPTTRWDIWVLRRDGERQAQPLLQGPSNEFWAALSPNGHWLAYASDESGREEVYVRPFPGSGGRWPISTDGGSQPAWARNGRELFYRNGDQMMAVTVASDATFSVTKPRVLFEAKALWSASYDVTPNGEFLVIEPGESDSPPSQINVVLNWAQELRQRVATR